MKTLTFIFLLFLHAGAHACSLVQMLDDFEHTYEQTTIPAKPEFKLASVRRGSKGDAGSCSELGSLTLSLTSEPRETGYIFTLVDGEVEEQLFSPDPIRLSEAAEPGMYSFVWLDGNTTEQEPLAFTVQIVAISKDGGMSEPQYLNVSHPGVKGSWWKLW